MRPLLRGGLMLMFSLTMFLSGVWVFFPRPEAVAYGLALMERRAGEKGVALSIRGGAAEGVLLPEFRAETLEGRSPLFLLRNTALEAVWHPLDSVLSGSLVLDLRWGAGSLEAFGKSLVWDGGEARLEIAPNVLRLRRLELRGELHAQGDLEVDPEAVRIRTADVRLGGAAELDPVFGAAAMVLPLQKEPGGTWRLVREAGHENP